MPSLSLIDLRLLAPAAVAFLLTALAMPVAMRAAVRLGVVATPEDPSGRAAPTPLLGGMPIIIGALAATACVSSIPWWCVVGASGLLAIGIWDDARPLAPMHKLVAQALIVIASVIWWSPEVPGLPRWVGGVVLVVWLLATINAFNLIDGLDGLAGGVGLIGALAIAAISLLHSDAPGAAGALAIAGALCAFLCFNFPPASVYMGDAGALPIGFLLGVMAVGAGLRPGATWVWEAATPVLIMLSPLLDMTIVSVSRMATDRRITRRGLDHSHHKLLALGLRERTAATLCWTVAALAAGCGVILTLIPEADALMALPFIVSFFGLIALFMVDLTFDISDPRDASKGLSLTARLILNFGYKRRLAEVGLDLWLITAAYFGAFLIRFDFTISRELVRDILPNLPILFVASFPAFFAFRIYRGIWRYTGLSDIVRLGNAAVVAGIDVMLIAHFIPVMVSGSILVLFVLLLFNLLVASRLSFRALRKGVGVLAHPVRRVLIIGVGETAEAAARFVTFSRERGVKLVGFVDLENDASKNGRLIHGSPVLGVLNQLEQIQRQCDCNELLIAEHSLTPHKMNQLQAFAEDRQIRLFNFSIGVTPLKRTFDPSASHSSKDYLLDESNGSKRVVA